MEKIIYMCICDSTYPRKLAFSYLDELSKEFQQSYGDKVMAASRPYAFMGFGESFPPIPVSAVGTILRGGADGRAISAGCAVQLSRPSTGLVKG